MEGNKGAELREHPDANVKCEVCGGRKSACAAIGHRPDRDRGVLWHLDDLAKEPVADRHTEPDSRWLGECAIRTLERLGYTYTGGSEWRPPLGKKPVWLDGVLSDEAVDRILSTHIPGGSQARWWFLPHDLPQGLANVRDVVRRMLTTYNKVTATPATPAAPSIGTASMYAQQHGLAVTTEWMIGWNACLDAIDAAALAQPAPVQAVAQQAASEVKKCPACDMSDGRVAPCCEECPQHDHAPATDEKLGAIAYKGFNDYWTEHCAGRDSEAWAASAKAVVAAYLAISGQKPAEEKVDCSSCKGTGSDGMGSGRTDCLGTGTQQ